MIKVVIFDLDDTLFSEKKYTESGFKEVSRFISDKVPSTNKLEVFNKLLYLNDIDPKNVFDRYLQDVFEKNDLSVVQLISVFKNHNPKIQFYDDVDPFIKYVKSSNIRLGVITDGYKDVQLKKINSLKLKDIFDEIIVTDELGREYWKPNPISFEILANKFNVKYDEMIYIGDNPQKDFFIGSLYPITTIRVLRNGYYMNAEYFKNVKEKYTVKSLLEVIDLIENL